VERSKSLYAPQIWKKTPGGTSPAIQIGFLNYPNEPRLTWHNQMSIPCELRLREFPEGLRLCRLPIDEIDNLRVGQQAWHDLRGSPGKNPLSAIQGDLFDIRAEIELAGASRFVITTRGQAVGYSVKDAEFTLGHAKAPLAPTAKRVRFQILVDRSSIELFADQGQATISRIVFPDPNDRSLSLTTEGGDIRVISLQVNRLESIWRENETRLGHPCASAISDK
jgi:sucrose-6-phosphate hydrolase SacC (GH32 family)